MSGLERIARTLRAPTYDFLIGQLRMWHALRQKDVFDGLSLVYGGRQPSGRVMDCIIDGYAQGVFEHVEHARSQREYVQGLSRRIVHGDFSAGGLPLESFLDYVHGFSAVVTRAETLSSAYVQAVNERFLEVARRYGLRDVDVLYRSSSPLLDIHVRSLPESMFRAFHDASWEVFDAMLRLDALYLTPSQDGFTDKFFLREFFRGSAFTEQVVEGLGHLKDFHYMQGYADLLASYTLPSVEK